MGAPLDSFGQSSAPATATAGSDSISGLRLRIPADRARQQLKKLFNEGMEIKSQPVHDQRMLEIARARRSTWCRSVSDALAAMFDGPSAGERFNSWAGRLLEEDATLNDFAAHFSTEMDHRLRRLRELYQHVRQLSVDQQISSVNQTTYRGVLAGRGTVPQAPSPRAPAAPKAAARAPGAKPNAEQHAGALIVYSADPQMRDVVAQFLSNLGLQVQVLEARSAAGGAAGSVPDGADAPSCSMLAELHKRRDLRFAILLVAAAQPDGADAGAAGYGPTQYDLGFCAGRFGPNRILILEAGSRQVTPAAGTDGIGRIPLDPADGWKLAVGRLLRQGGIPIDMNRIA